MRERPLADLIATHSHGLSELGKKKIHDLVSNADPDILKRIEALYFEVIGRSEKFIPNDAQLLRIKANVLAYRNGRSGAFNTIKQRCGKTPIALLTLYVLDRLHMLKHRRALITCPPTPGSWKWVSEIKEMFGNEVDGYALDENPIGVLSEAAKHNAQKLEIYVIGHPKFRKTYRTMPIASQEAKYLPEAVAERVRKLRAAKAISYQEGNLSETTLAELRENRTAFPVVGTEEWKEWAEKVNSRYRFQRCPACGEALKGTHGFPLFFKENSKNYCPECKTALYQPKTEGGSFKKYVSREKLIHQAVQEAEARQTRPMVKFALTKEQTKRDYSPPMYLRRFLRKEIDVWVADEIHELKAGPSSGQGTEGLRMSTLTKFHMGLTGTPSDGKASNLFYLAWMMYRKKMEELGFRFKDLRRFIKTYGVLETFETIPVEDGVITNKKSSVRTRERAGLDKRVMAEIFLENMITGHLKEFFGDTVEYSEGLQIIEMSPEQEAEYNSFANDAKYELTQALLRHDHSRLASYFQSLYSCLDHSHDGRSMTDPYDVNEETGEKRVLAHYSAISPEIHPKEQALIDLVRTYHENGHKMLIYCEDTATVDITKRLKMLLEQELGLSFAILGKEKAKGRETRINKMVADGLNGVFCNPKRVKTGSDFPWATRIIFFQTPLSTFDLDQASQRALGIFQKVSCRSDYMMYGPSAQSLQAEKQALKKYEMDMFTGLLPQGFATGMSDEDDSLLEALAKAFINGEKTSSEDLAKQWAESREVKIAEDEEVPVTEIIELPVSQHEEPGKQILETTAKLIGESLVETQIFREVEDENPNKPKFGDLKVNVRRRKVKAVAKEQLGFGF